MISQSQLREPQLSCEGEFRALCDIQINSSTQLPEESLSYCR